jgi:hypothetical protein
MDFEVRAKSDKAFFFVIFNVEGIENFFKHELINLILVH